MTDSYHFDDGDEATGEDLFEREPYVVRFNAKHCGKSERKPFLYYTDL